jgi:hypothetical protein
MKCSMPGGGDYDSSDPDDDDDALRHRIADDV